MVCLYPPSTNCRSNENNFYSDKWRLQNQMNPKKDVLPQKLQMAGAEGAACTKGPQLHAVGSSRGSNNVFQGCDDVARVNIYNNREVLFWRLVQALTQVYFIGKNLFALLGIFFIQRPCSFWVHLVTSVHQTLGSFPTRQFVLAPNAYIFLLNRSKISWAPSYTERRLHAREVSLQYKDAALALISPRSQQQAEVSPDVRRAVEQVEDVDLLLDGQGAAGDVQSHRQVIPGGERCYSIYGRELKANPNGVTIVMFQVQFLLLCGCMVG